MATLVNSMEAAIDSLKETVRVTGIFQRDPLPEVLETQTRAIESPHRLHVPLHRK